MAALASPDSGLGKVRAQYGRLAHVVSSLNHNTRELLLRERSEFLGAYRSHTYKIQSELRELRRRVAEEQSSQQKDEKVKQLTEDCDWFREEALSLDKKGVTLRSALHGLKEKLEVAEDDRCWLERELQRTRTGADLLRVALNKEPDQGMADTGMLESAFLQTTFQSSAELLGASANRLGRAAAQDVSGLEDRIGSERRAAFRLQREIDVHRRSTRPPTPECAALRDALIRSVAAVDRERLDRRDRALRASHRDTVSASTGTFGLAESASEDVPPDLTRFEVDKFTATDRVRVLEYFTAAAATRVVLARLVEADDGPQTPDSLDADGLR
ncbi:hypothetical protein M885DRAFT_523271 [Pelagophyceae sp. CCMP2097]|nr:hypothetical protein M885DRAFT_523271 [Pelagophyceae sp. CCMP2097]